jgi:hypothetical protein
MEKILCDYGCGQEANFKLKNGKNCCSKSSNSCIKIKGKNSEGLKKAYEEGRKSSEHLHKEGVNNWAKGKHWFDDKRIKVDYNESTMFIENSKINSGIIKNYLMEQKDFIYKCNNCNLNEWFSHKIILEMHHKNGNEYDQRKENLEFLCPNCHSITDTYRCKNVKNRIKNSCKKVTDEELIISLKSSKSIAMALRNVCLSPKGANYKRAYNLILKSNNEELIKLIK